MIDSIFEAYAQINEATQRQVEHDASYIGRVEKIVKNIAGKLGTKYDKNTITLSMGDIIKGDVISNSTKDAKKQKENKFEVRIIDDIHSDKVQVIIMFGGNINFNRSTVYYRTKDPTEVTKVLVKYLNDITPKPSADDINKSHGRFRNGRM